MTEAQEPASQEPAPQQPAPQAPDLGLPTAGRKPEERSTVAGERSGDEPTVVVGPAGADETLPPAEPVAAAPGPVAAEPEPVAVDNEPTVEGLTPPRPPVGFGGDTVRLTPPAVVPGPPSPAAESPEPVTAATSSAGTGSPADGPRAPWRRWSSAGALIWVLLALFGFTLVVQLRSNSADDGLATARQEDLVRILSDLEARDQRLQSEITSLEQSQRRLTSGVEGRQAALADAQKRADELGLLAGTLAGKGPGLRIVIDPKGLVKASAILNAVQELRGAGGEVMQIDGANGTAVRIVASTYFVDAGAGAVTVDGKRLAGPYTIWVIGVPQTMQTALQIPGGVVASVIGAGGSVTMDVRDPVEVSALHEAPSLQYARPVS